MLIYKCSLLKVVKNKCIIFCIYKDKDLKKMKKKKDKYDIFVAKANTM